MLAYKTDNVDLPLPSLALRINIEHLELRRQFNI